MVTEILKNYIPEHAEALSEQQYAQLERYAELLVEWNEKMNLTAITDPEGIAVKHFLDCLAFLRRAKIPEGASVADVGTGAGFPGIPIKRRYVGARVSTLNSHDAFSTLLVDNA